MEDATIWLGLIGALIALPLAYANYPKLPKYDDLGDISGEKFFGFAQIGREKHPVHFIVGEMQLGITGGFPSFSLRLEINELELFKQQKLFGYQVRIISHDVYTEHLFEEIIVSSRVAKKLAKFSNGRLVCKDV